MICFVVFVFVVFFLVGIVFVELVVFDFDKFYFNLFFIYDYFGYFIIDGCFGEWDVFLMIDKDILVNFFVEFIIDINSFDIFWVDCDKYFLSVDFFDVEKFL